MPFNLGWSSILTCHGHRMMIFGFSTELKTQAVAVAFSIAWLQGEVEPQPDGARDRLAVFRRELYRCIN